VNQAGETLKGMGARVIPLKVSAPFHSPLMQPAADSLKEELSKYTYSDLKYPVISNVTAEAYKGKESIIENLFQQIVKPVQWMASMKYLQGQGIEMALEMGPQNVLKNLMKKNVPEISVYSYDKEEDVKVVKEKLAGGVTLADADKNAKLKLIIRCIAITVCTRNRNWNNDEYQKGVVEPYRKVQQMLDTLEKEDREPALEQMTEALEMLRSVFVTKKTPVEEQIERFNQVFDETGTRHLFPDFKMPS
jgi:[acyl-carrier-protein] S-malonyltransferase